MGKTAIIIGATGLTGGFVLQHLLEDERYEKVKVISRRPIERKHDKLEVCIVDLLDPDSWKSQVVGDELYCCIGTTMKKTPNKDVYESIDLGIPLNAAKASKENGVKTFLVVSAIGANSKSKIFYNNLKGRMEDAVKLEGPERVFVMRPSMIDGARKEGRVLEKIGMVLFKGLNLLMLGPLKKYRSISAENIAVAMIKAANSDLPSKTFESNEIQKLADMK